MAIQKSTTDQDTRGRTLNAANIEKTLGSIDQKALLQYSGAVGALKKAADMAQSPFTNVKNYTEYTNAKNSAEMLATQVRQFYKDSIQPGMIARLEKLTNPESFFSTPEQAEENYNQIMSILKKEGFTYQSGVKDTSSYGPEGSTATPNQQMNNQPSQEETVIIVDPNGNPRRIPKSQEAAARADLARRKSNG